MSHQHSGGFGHIHVSSKDRRRRLDKGTHRWVLEMALLLLLLPGTGGTKAEVRPTRAAARAMTAALESFMISGVGRGLGDGGCVGVWVWVGTSQRGGLI